MRIRAHLCFDGRCAEAFRFYQQTFGGRLDTLMTYGDSPLAAHTPADQHGRILHATLVLDGHELLGADVAPGDYQRPAGVFVLVSFTDAARAADVFAALAEGGEVKLPFQATFWSPGFGVVIDRFAIPWEITAEATPV